MKTILAISILLSLGFANQEIQAEQNQARQEAMMQQALPNAVKAGGDLLNQQAAPAAQPPPQ